jgi:uncharacterized membrane protein
MHYFPLALPLLFILLFLFLVLIDLIEIGILGYAYQRMGIDRRYVFSVLLLSLLGTYINILLFQLSPERIVSGQEVFFLGMRHMIPVVREWPGTVVAVNVGGAIIPFFLSLYLMRKNGLYGPALSAVAVVAFVVYQMAYPIAGLGIAVPVFVPPLLAAVVALMLSRKSAPALAYITGTLGTLIGADVMNLSKMQGLGAPVASIGGAGTFDGYSCRVVGKLDDEIKSCRMIGASW